MSDIPYSQHQSEYFTSSPEGRKIRIGIFLWYFHCCTVKISLQNQNSYCSKQINILIIEQIPTLQFLPASSSVPLKSWEGPPQIIPMWTFIFFLFIFFLFLVPPHLMIQPTIDRVVVFIIEKYPNIIEKYPKWTFIFKPWNYLHIFKNLTSVNEMDYMLDKLSLLRTV